MGPYDFAKPTSVSAAEVYWLDDTGKGDVRVPASWRVLYKDGADWKPVEAAGPAGIALDRFNRLTFKPVTTSALRLEVTAQPQWSAGPPGVEGRVALSTRAPRTPSTRARSPSPS